jgi:hypothetical protein
MSTETILSKSEEKPDLAVPTLFCVMVKNTPRNFWEITYQGNEPAIFSFEKSAHEFAIHLNVMFPAGKYRVCSINQLPGYSATQS